MIVLIDPLFAQHDPGEGHPERPERIFALLQMLQTFPYRAGIEFMSLRRGSWREVAWVHADRYLDLLKEVSGSRAVLDPDTPTSPNSVDIALAAAASTLAVAERVSDTKRPGFAMIRPPGHHAEADRAMGFCLLNNAAVGAEWALREAGARRVAIIDFDAHHGNGTQHIFYHREDVLYVSTHQFPYYPGSGAMNESGAGRGEGFTVNFPLQAGVGDSAFIRIYEDLVPIILEQYRPDWIFVSAGYDAHRKDPLAQLEVTERGFARVTQSLQRCARDFCDGKILYLLEGGYDLEALAASVSESLKVILQKATLQIDPLAEPRGWKEYIAALRQVHERWRF
ncbi:MAG: histone deacetylase [Acidobacteria bacterium]|nr:histone deacetylase [Acidobacteriota bacterium]